jgi:hypothetical protein
MPNLYPFLFRFGVSFNYGIPKEITSSLKDFLSKKYSIQVDLTLPDDSFDCIAIKDTEAKDCTPILAHKFSERLQEYYVTDFNNSILFIDIKRAYSDKFIDSYLIPELVKIKTEKMSALTTSGFPKFILYFDELDNKSLTYDNLFLSQTNHKLLDYCFVFDKNAKVLNNKLDFEQDRTLLELINNISTSSLERFQFKLVRKINHFKRVEEKTNIHIACQQFFYEGRNCKDEAYQLMKDELVQLKRSQNIDPHYIVYDCVHSKWLSMAIETVANYISSASLSDTFTNFSVKHQDTHDNHLNLNNEEDSRNQKGWKDETEMEIIFITDLIHTGNTFREKIKRVVTKFPKSTFYCLSALVTDKAFEDYKGAFQEADRKIKIKNYEIKYFKKVEQIYMTKSANRENCHMCKHKLLPLVETTVDVTEHLSSFEMWLMCEEAGYKLEDYRPRKNREDVNRIVPHSLKLFKKNGTLLAIKYEEHLRLNDIKPRDEIVIIYPDETKNDPEEAELPESIEKTPSGYFAKCLNFYNDNYSYLGIPRKMIRLLEEGNADMHIAKEHYPKLFKQIEEIDKPIVIMDEVNFTGKTFKTITDILRSAGKEPSCYFPVFDFDAETTCKLHQDIQYQSIKFLNLYELNLIP